MEKQAAVASPHVQATVAARDVLRKGGNAFDAAVAGMLSMCVVQPNQVGLGGYGGALVGYLGDEKRAVAIDFDSRAALAFTPAAFADPADRTSGYRSITIPAVLAGLELARKTYGTMPPRRLLAHAIHCAENGFAVDATLAECLVEWNKKTDDESRQAFFADGKIPRQGEVWIQKDLARVLHQIANEGADSFYKGDIGQTIARQINLRGGILRERDFHEYQARLVEPLLARYRDHEVCTPPPPAGGITTLQILKTLEHFDIAKLTPWSAPYFHLLVQAAKLCWQERMKFLGDPDFIKVPVAQMLSDQSASERAQRIEAGTISGAVPVPKDRPCTANISVMDGKGNAVSLTATQGVYFGSQLVIPGTGIIMNHGMSRFDFPVTPNHPNAPLPGKRMQHNMGPAIILKDQEPRFAMGLPGGTKIVTVTAQLAVNLVDFKASPHEAVRAPRAHTLSEGPVSVSSAVSDAIMDELRAMGHEVVRGQVDGPPMEIGGNANIVSVDPATGKAQAASQASKQCGVVI